MTPKVIERRTVHRHPPVALLVLPKPRPAQEASGNPGHGLVTVATAAGIDITLSEKMAPKMQAFIADLMEIGYKPKQIYCPPPHVVVMFAARGITPGMPDLSDQRGWGKTAKMMYHVSVLAKLH